MINSLTLTAKFSLLVLLASIVLVGCSPAQQVTPAPTLDSNTLVAAAVQTLGAQMTEEAIRNPSATPTTAPTATQPPTATPVPPTATPSKPLDTATPVATKAPAVSGQGLYAATYPESKNTYIPNEKFGLALGFKNTGTTDWAPGTVVKLVSFKGEVTVQTETSSNQGVKPGEKIEYNLWAFGSETLGQHTWYFQVYSNQGYPIPGASIAFTYTSQ